MSTMYKSLMLLPLGLSIAVHTVEQHVMTMLLVGLAGTAMLGQPKGSALSSPALLPGGSGPKGCQSS